MYDYQLLDFGGGRKLERFGAWILDRPAPAAEGVAPATPHLWADADAQFVRSSWRSHLPEGISRGRRPSPRRRDPSPKSASREEGPLRQPGPAEGQWKLRRELPESWTVAFGPVMMEVRLTPFGHVGVFPEQAENWAWIGKRVAREGSSVKSGGAARCKLLNLFAYTGGATLAAAAAGAEVTHIDAAKNIVAWARRNAQLSGLADAPIRWIAEDARKFVARELRRGARYDAVIVDPPSYGHGPKGQAWKIEQHLPPLLADCARLTEGRRAFFLLTCHTPGYGPAELSSLLLQAGIAPSPAEIEARNLELTAENGRRLACGAAARGS